jgi:hypothetical protein
MGAFVPYLKSLRQREFYLEAVSVNPLQRGRDPCTVGPRTGSNKQHFQQAMRSAGMNTFKAVEHCQPSARRGAQQEKNADSPIGWHTRDTMIFTQSKIASKDVAPVNLRQPVHVRANFELYFLLPLIRFAFALKH